MSMMTMMIIDDDYGESRIYRPMLQRTRTAWA